MFSCLLLLPNWKYNNKKFNMAWSYIVDINKHQYMWTEVLISISGVPIKN